jgi:hypothetical protein
VWFNNDIEVSEDTIFFFFCNKEFGFFVITLFFFVGLGLGPRNWIDDGFDIGKKDSVRMGGVVGPTNVGPINSRLTCLQISPPLKFLFVYV